MNLFTLQQQEFIGRHIGPSVEEKEDMLKTIGVENIQELINKTIPQNIQYTDPVKTGTPMSEAEYLKELWDIAGENKMFKTYIGQGYYGTLVPTVILRNLFENPGWYTQYTPYQAEIAQGRLESLLNFQTSPKTINCLS